MQVNYFLALIQTVAKLVASSTLKDIAKSRQGMWVYKQNKNSFVCKHVNEARASIVITLKVLMLWGFAVLLVAVS